MADGDGKGRSRSTADGATPTEPAAATARVAFVRVRGEYADGASLAFELLLSLSTGGHAVLELTAAELRHMLDQATAAMAGGPAAPN